MKIQFTMRSGWSLNIGSRNEKDSVDCLIDSRKQLITMSSSHLSRGLRFFNGDKKSFWIFLSFNSRNINSWVTVPDFLFSLLQSLLNINDNLKHKIKYIITSLDEKLLHKFPRYFLKSSLRSENSEFSFLNLIKKVKTIMNTIFSWSSGIKGEVSMISEVWWIVCLWDSSTWWKKLN